MVPVNVLSVIVTAVAQISWLKSLSWRFVKVLIYKLENITGLHSLMVRDTILFPKFHHVGNENFDNVCERYRNVNYIKISYYKRAWK